ncbi:MAG TPA: amidase [Acidimicrobiales bacterium]|jgi:amidase|nr:amidase [Acidimicrobiales bacterium]
MVTFILRIDEPGGPGPDAPRLAVKDLIDVVGTPTTAGSAAVAATAAPAPADAPCVAAARAAGARIVGKTNLHELAFGGSGINPHFGTPVNPLDPDRIPGGSSSGSAVAVATGEADVAIGTDTAGSVRTPSACCGTVGLKTTRGRIPTAGVWPLAPSLDTVGPMARDVAGVRLGLRFLDPGFTDGEHGRVATTIGRVRLPSRVDPVVDRAVDDLLAACGLDVVDFVLPGWGAAVNAGTTLLFGEAWRTNRSLYETSAAALGAETRERLEQGRAVTPGELDAARDRARRWSEELARVFAGVDVLAWPTLPVLPTRLDEPPPDSRTHNVPVNLAGLPALALPAPTAGPLPASVQLSGPRGSEALLLATGAWLEAAAMTRS